MYLDEIIKEALLNPCFISRLENGLAKRLRNESISNRNNLLFNIILCSEPRVSSMGFRLVKRCVRDKQTLNELIHRCFKQKKLVKVEKFYEAILSRYSYKSFGNKIIHEIESREKDRYFFMLHSSAVYIVFNRFRYKHHRLNQLITSKL